MIQANPTLQTFDDFLATAEGLEVRYELTNGELIEMPPETYGNLVIARFLDRVLSEIVGFQHVCTHQVVLEMPGQPKNRFPDLIVLHPDHPEQLMSQKQASIRLDMAPPMLVIEIVSPGSENHRRDYIDKRNQYEWRGIPEYWIADPVLGQITVLVLTDNGYEEAVFSGDALVRSPAFPELTVTTEAILSPT
ncbi:MAG: Uma2 family endonuclease [Leptolyngbyaceae bacterium]|nr:Uma2 family endonuclease [Leptolyngbyaceae bacterium]